MVGYDATLRRGLEKQFRSESPSLFRSLLCAKLSGSLTIL